MIKKGAVNCYDNNYNYLFTLKQGSFFGELNLLFGLYSSIIYKSVPA